MLVTVSGDKMLTSSHLRSCQKDSGFSAKRFNVLLTRKNASATFSVDAISSINGYVNFTIIISAYGYEVARKVLDPCSLGLTGLCPMVSGKLPKITFATSIGEKALDKVPEIAYTIPDLDANVRVYINGSVNNAPLACVEASISNGMTVDLAGIKWATAAISALTIISSAFVHGIGQHNTAAHIAANSLALLSYFQAVAMVGLTGIHLPPVVASWTQNFQWSMGVIRVDSMQRIFTWYQRATGGSPSTILESLKTQSVQVEKRSSSLLIGQNNQPLLEPSGASTSPSNIIFANKRSNIVTDSGSYLVYGIQRVAFQAKIEATNLFMTGLILFVLFVLCTMLSIVIFKSISELLVSKKFVRADWFLDFRCDWVRFLKGIVCRLALLGFAPMCILCLWEFAQRDSPAEVTLSALYLIGLIGTLARAAVGIIGIGRRSAVMYHNHAYALFSDHKALNKWGFLYMQFRATAYYFIAVVLIHSFIKSALVAFAQSKPNVQAMGLFLVDVLALIGALVLRPWMDKPTNSLQMAVYLLNSLNGAFLLIFSGIIVAPPIVASVAGVAFFILNAAFSVIFLVMIITCATFNLFRTNPDARYQLMADDRASFIKSRAQFNNATELDALAITACRNIHSCNSQMVSKTAIDSR